MRILALDVDGVLLDPERAGDGHWTNDLENALGITRNQLRHAFFMTSWDDVVNGRRPIEPALAEALTAIGVDDDVEDVLAIWFEADFAPVEPAVDLARRAADAGVRVVLATNQEPRRVAFLRERLGAIVPFDDVLYSGDLGVQKHDPEFFELASERLGVDDDRRGDILFVDDVEHNVVQARRAGWRGVHASPDNGWIDEVERALEL